MAGVGASVSGQNQMLDERDPDMAGQRGTEKEGSKYAGTKGDKGAEPAENRLNESA